MLFQKLDFSPTQKRYYLFETLLPELCPLRKYLFLQGSWLLELAVLAFFGTLRTVFCCAKYQFFGRSLCTAFKAIRGAVPLVCVLDGARFASTYFFRAVRASNWLYVNFLERCGLRFAAQSRQASKEASGCVRK